MRRTCQNKKKKEEEDDDDDDERSKQNITNTIPTPFFTQTKVVVGILRW
jgi:hypothetical protein